MALVVVALYDVIFTLRVSGDPTESVIDVTMASATTINNPGYRESRSGKEYKLLQLHFLILTFIFRSFSH